MNEVIFNVGMRLEELEKMAILKVVNHFRGNKTTAATSLGIDRRTLDHRLERYADDEERQKERVLNDQLRREEQLSRARGNPPNNVGIPYNSYQNASKSEYPAPDAGVRVEPPVHFTPKQTMPLSQREEIQGVLPEHSSKSHSIKRRS